MVAEKIIFCMYLGVSLLFIGLGFPLWRDWVPPNRWYGFRRDEVCRDPRLWYPVNRATGRWLVLTGIVTAPVAIANWMLQSPVDAAALTNLAACGGGMILLLIEASLTLRRERRRMGEEQSDSH